MCVTGQKWRKLGLHIALELNFTFTFEAEEHSVWMEYYALPLHIGRFASLIQLNRGSHHELIGSHQIPGEPAYAQLLSPEKSKIKFDVTLKCKTHNLKFRCLIKSYPKYKFLVPHRVQGLEFTKRVL